MGFLTVDFKPAKFLQALERKAQRFPQLMLYASRNIMRTYVDYIVELTPKPGDAEEGFNVDYVRTGRLAGGWGAAASALGLPTPFGSGEGRFEQVVTEGEIRITAQNDVPYALFVETIGPWLIPPNAPGGPRFRGGRHMVENARNLAISSGIIEREIERQWKRL